jgi:hypothetical protein
MRSSSQWVRERGLYALAVWCIWQLRSIEPDEATLEKLGFGSAEAMRIQLENWDVPPWVTQGKPAAEKPEARKPAAPEQRARQGGGEAEELPPASGAIELFRSAIGRLKSDLWYVEHLEEALQDNRFVQTFYYPKEGGMHANVYLRKDLSPERWQELCAEQGQDPATTDTLYVPLDRTFVAEASPFPAQQLVRLIAVYLLCAARTWHDVEVLLERLHRSSREPDVDQIRRYLTGETPSRRRDDALRPIAWRLAKLVRGGEVKQGRDPRPLDPFDHAVARRIRDLKERGVSEEDVSSVIKEDYELAEDEIVRLEKLFPPRPPE